MADTVENLILDLVEWAGRKERDYHGSMAHILSETFGLGGGNGPRAPGENIHQWPFVGKSFPSRLGIS